MNKITALNRLTDTPLLLSPEHAKMIFGYLSKRNGMALIDAEGEKVGAVEKLFFGKPTTRGDSKPYSVSSGIAVIPVDGSLAHRYGYLDTHSGITGYDGIEAKLNFAEKDEEVNGVFLDVCSGGGEVSGCFELGELIQNYSKPTFGYADGYAYSAAYALLASCDNSGTSKNGKVGSIGVVIAHRDYSQAIKEDHKTNITLIYSGAHKVDGNPYQPLPEAVKNKWQGEIDALREGFAEHVSVKRAIAKEQALKTEADIYRGEDALDAGLIDLVMGKQEALSHFLSTLSHESTSEGSEMTVKQDSSVEATAEAIEDQEVSAETEITAANKRMVDVLGSDQAKENVDLASHLLTNSTMTAGQIVDALKMASQPTASFEIEGAGVEADPDQLDAHAEIEHRVIV